MAELKNSALLDSILDHARSLDGSSRTMTAERFIISVIDALNGDFSVEIGDEESDQLKALLRSRLVPDEPGFQKTRSILEARIAEKNSASYLDGLYIQQCTYRAKETAKKNGLEELSPALLLECILGEPNAFLKNRLMPFSESGTKASEPDPDTGSKLDGETVEDIERILRKVLLDDEESGGEAGEGSSAEAPPAPEPKTALAMLTEKVKLVQARLLESVYGQDNAVSVFTAGYFQAELLAMTDKQRTRPRATFLFAGPPGVGKTFLAEQAAKVLDLPFQRFDMSEYADKEANLEFCGTDKVYKNGKEGNVTSFVAKHPKCVLLFDEIEKAHIVVIHLFLQLLDAGRLRDSYTDQEVSFTDTIIIFTTNAGKPLYETAETADFSAMTRKVILKALQKDVDPNTGVPYFPAALCSRFASGNVVMFNHMTAHDLRQIAKKEVLRHASNFEKEMGIRVGIEEQVFTALLFAEGGAADARTIRSRAETFFDDELFELFRLLASEKVAARIEDLESIRIGVELPREKQEILELFGRGEKQTVLLFSSEETCRRCAMESGSVEFLNAQSIDEARKVLQEREIGFALIDPRAGVRTDAGYLNLEDVDSAARDFFWFMKGSHGDEPLYLLQLPGQELNAEEQLSFLRLGVRGVLALKEDGTKLFDGEIRAISEQLCQQRNMDRLAKANKLVAFETAQLICDGGKTAEIRLFDFETETAIDAEDSKNILSSVSKPNVRFDQVIGAEDAKKELKYFVEYLKNPKKYMGTGVSAPKGVLLYGPPGTGKTMLAKAMASESDVTFITAEGNQFLKKYVGEGPEKVHELFRTARKYAPAILFVDEIDAIAKERRGGENSAAEETLTAFLTEMDGFKNDNARPVFVLAATNFDVEPGKGKSLDGALMRRFDRRVYIDLPNREERIRFIRMRIAEKRAIELSEEKIRNIAVRSTGMSLAQLESIVELALRTAIRDGGLKVTDEIFEEAFETFNSGESKTRETSQLERIARHEAGHAFLCWKSGETPSYVTVVARGDHGGYMQHDDREDKMIYTREDLLDRIRTALGGRAAELVYYGDKDGVSTGASGDLASATSIARQIICTYGMDEKFGLAVISPQEAESGSLSLQVRGAVNQLLAEELKKAVELIRANRGAIDRLVEKLLSENHLSGEKIRALFEESAS